MKKDLTIKEIKQLKLKLEMDLSHLITKFIQETCVNDLSIKMINTHIEGQEYPFFVEVKTEIKL